MAVCCVRGFCGARGCPQGLKALVSGGGVTSELKHRSPKRVFMGFWAARGPVFHVFLGVIRTGGASGAPTREKATARSSGASVRRWTSWDAIDRVRGRFRFGVFLCFCGAILRFTHPVE